MTPPRDQFKELYSDLFINYVIDKRERHLVAAAELGRSLVQADLQIEEIAEIHHEAIVRLAREHPELSFAEISSFLSMPLVELLMAYGLAYRRHLSEKRAMEEQLYHSQQLEAIGQLAGGVAHDMNNILSAITGVVSVLEVKLERDHPMFSDIESVLAACRRGHDLTRNLLSFARKGKLERFPLSLNDAAREARKLLSRTVPKGITIRMQLEDELAQAMADAGQLTHVLVNLALNAVDAMGERGVLSFETETLTVDRKTVEGHPGVHPGAFVRLRVSDTGEGMSEEVRAHAFEPFFTTKEVGKGTGLGLSMVHGTVREHGGFVELDSVEGEGTTVSIYLPALAISTECLERPGDAPDELRGRGSGVVLLVDDEDLVRLSGRCVLEELGYSVLFAENGRKAVKIYESRGEEIDFVILDLMMPVMDGAETFIALKEIDPEVKVLIATGYFKGDKANLLLDSGALGVVEKPYTLQGLGMTIAKCVTSSPDSRTVAG